MKSTGKISPKQTIIILVIFVTIIVIGLSYLVNNYFNYQNELEKIKNKSIRGIIIESQNESRGFYHIKIKDNISDSILSYSLPQSWFFKQNNIQNGDSVNKEPDSEIMEFYKKKDSVYKKCCEYEISM